MIAALVIAAAIVGIVAIIGYDEWTSHRTPHDGLSDQEIAERLAPVHRDLFVTERPRRNHNTHTR